MPAGIAGSTLCAELNRLANGGTYPARTAFLDSQGAANVWAGTSGLGIIGALNQKASAGRAPSAYKNLNGVCNELAGTTNKSASDALRTIAS
jgi:hypothetical protein